MEIQTTIKEFSEKMETLNISPETPITVIIEMSNELPRSKLRGISQRDNSRFYRSKLRGIRP